MPRSCLEIMDKFGVQSHIPPWIVVDASDSDRLPEANDSLGVTAQEHQKLFLQEIKELTSRLPPAASGREMEQEMHRSVIPAILLIHISRCLQIEKS